MTYIPNRLGTAFVAALVALAAVAFAAPVAEAGKKKKLDGQLIGAAEGKGSKVEAPVLLSQKSAKKLKLRSPIATLSLKASKEVAAPNPAGGGEVKIAPETLRAGDEIKGKGKVKGKRKKLMPKVKAGKLEVTDRESAYSVDELTGALIALYQQVGILGLRVDALEVGFAQLRAEIEALKAEDASLQAQLDDLLAQITDLETGLAALTNVVNGLPTQAELDAVIADIEDLQDQIDLLVIEDADLQGQIDTINTQLGTITSDIMALQTDVGTICGSLMIC